MAFEVKIGELRPEYVGKINRYLEAFDRIESGIESLLENFDAEELFSHIEGNPDDVIDTPNESKDYTITIEYKKKPSRTITGSYDKNGLPEDFADFAETVLDFKSYYYLTEDDSIEIGDFVLVPAGKYNHEAVVEVVNIEYFSEENVPFPIEKTKRIIRKCTDEEFDPPA